MLTKYHDLKSIPNQSDICLSSVSSGVLYDNKRKKTELENVRYFSHAKPILRAEKGIDGSTIIA